MPKRIEPELLKNGDMFNAVQQCTGIGALHGSFEVCKKLSYGIRFKDKKGNIRTFRNDEWFYEKVEK